MFIPTIRKLSLAAALLSVGFCSAAFPDGALAQHGGRGPAHGVVFVGGYFYDPFFGPYPWWGPSAYAYPYFPVYDDRAEVRVLVTPKNAAVYVDGYYAGIVDDFDGALQSLPLSPGAHQITIFLEGYKTVHQSLYLTPRKSYKVRYALQPVAAGEQSEAPPSTPPPVPPPPPGSARLPRTPRGGAPDVPVASDGQSVQAAAGFGTLALRVQPGDADVLIDGEKWNTSQPGERLLVQVAAGRHHVDVQKAGYRSYATDIQVDRGQTSTLNVSLSSQ